MNRSSLLSVVEKVAPAIASSSVIPVFRCLYFEPHWSGKGHAVYAYDDVVAIYHPVDFAFEGGIQGSVVLPWLKAMKAKEITLSEGKEEGTVVLVGGRSRLKVAVLPRKDFVFEMPSAGEDEVEVHATSLLVQQLRNVMIAMGSDPTAPWRMGVTLHCIKGKATMYATDNFISARAELQLKSSSAVSVILPPRFCTLFQAFAKIDTPVKVLLSEEWVSATFTSGMVLFARAISDVQVSTYRELWKAVDKKLNAANGAVAVPRGFARSLERSLAVLSPNSPRVTKFAVTDEVLAMDTTTDMGQVREKQSLVSHPDVEVVCPPELMLKVSPLVGWMFLSQEWAYFLGDNDIDFVVGGAA